jgi:hypothetical protein
VRELYTSQTAYSKINLSSKADKGRKPMTYDEAISKILNSEKDDWVNLTITNSVAVSVNKQVLIGMQ